jgi:hypothetical protein
VSDYRINIGNGKVIVSTYSANQFVAEETMHDIIEAVTKGEICVEEKQESWVKVPT